MVNKHLLSSNNWMVLCFYSYVLSMSVVYLWQVCDVNCIFSRSVIIILNTLNLNLTLAL